MVGLSPGSLGPANPCWLAKLSAHLGINPVKTLSVLLSSIWPGKEIGWACCREICALLMLTESHTAALVTIHAHLQQALNERRVVCPPLASLRSLIEQDRHFELDLADHREPLVRLLLETIPAHAVARLYLPPGADTYSSGHLLTAEKALLHAALHLTWPLALRDDDEYLAAQIALLLIDGAEAFPGANRGLTRYSMHLTEVGGCLRTQSNCDMRLAQIFPKGQYMKAKRPRLSEFLMKENLLEYFRVQESTLRQSEKVVTLRTEVLLRSLGPLVGLVESTLSGHHAALPGPRLTSGPNYRQLPDDALRLSSAVANGSGWAKPVAPQLGPMDEAQPKGLPESLSHLTIPQHLEDDLQQLVGNNAVEPASVERRQHRSSFAAFSPSSMFNSGDLTASHSIFSPGLNLRSAEVPPEIRNFWLDAPVAPPPAPPAHSLDGKLSSPVVGMPTPTKLEPTLVGRLGAIGGSAQPPRASTGDTAASWQSAGGLGGQGPAPHWSSASALGSPSPQRLDPNSQASSSGKPSTIMWSPNGDDGKARTPLPPDWGRAASAAAAPAGAAPSLPSPQSSYSDVSSHTALSTLQTNVRGRMPRGPLYISGGTSADNGNSPHASELQSTSSYPVDSARRSMSQLSGSLATSSCWGGKLSPLAQAQASNGFAAGPSHSDRDACARGAADADSAGDGGKGSQWPCSGEAGPPHAPDSAGVVSVSASTGDVTPCGSAPSGGLRPMNYATALRAPGMPGPPPPPPRGLGRISDDPGPGLALDRDSVEQLLDERGQELIELLGEPWADCVVADVVAWRQSCVRDGRINREELNRLFLVSAKRYLTGEESLIGRIDKASASTLKVLLLTDDHRGSLPFTPAASAPVVNPLSLLRPQVRNEVLSLIEQYPGVLREEHFDSGVVFHLQRKSEAASIAALRAIAQRSDFLTANNMPAYLTHWLMKVGGRADVAPPPPPGAANAIKPSLKPSKPDLRKLPRGVAKAVEDLVEASQWLDWRHFDAGVMKVLQQLAQASEEEAYNELQQVEDSELSSVKNMPAYLNKCFNNRLWKIRP